MPYSVGKSSYPDLRGQTQYVATAEIARQVASLCYEFDTQVAKGGDRLTVNEGIRSRERQIYLRNQYLYHNGALAAYCTWGPPPVFTSTHDESRGSALDFGITRPDGSNRALTQAEFNWLHARAPQRGIRWTGASFSRVEQWHHNGGYPATVPPITGVNLPGEPIKIDGSAKPAPKPDPTPLVTTSFGGMQMLFQSKQTKFWYLVGEFSVQKFTAKADALPYSQALKRSTQVDSARMKTIIKQTADRREAVFGKIDDGLQALLDDRNL